MRLAVLASGSGTILDAMARWPLPIALVLLDRRCAAEEVARRHDIGCETLERSGYGPDFDREAYTRQVVERLQAADINLVAMAGFGTILGQAAQDVFGGRILNTHPSLLPAFPGWHAVDEALAYGVKVTGCTVHIAALEVDAGPILAQQAVEVREGDTSETLHERIKQVERELYPRTVEEILQRGYVREPEHQT